MKCIYHKQDDTYRVVNRGRLFYVQQRNGDGRGTREADPWNDTGIPKDTVETAQALMYTIKPLVKP